MRSTPRRALGEGTLLGRERELTLAFEALGARRIVTVLGPSGVGKTRFAEGCAAALLAKGEIDGFALAELGDARTRGDVLAVVARALELPALSSATLVAQGEQVLDELARASGLLLILDGAEHVVAPLAELATSLSGLGGARVLVTSLAPLDIGLEQRLELGPLDAASARTLMLERVARRRADFRPDGGDTAALDAIAARVDRLPLALELAAARLDLLSPVELFARLGDTLDVLASTRRDVPPRHRAMRAALEGSWELLTPGERRVLAALSVFRGGFTARAVERMMPEVDALVVLTRLRELSLVVQLGPARLGLYELVRELASYKLQSDPSLGLDERALELAHARYFCDLGDELAKVHEGVDAAAPLAPLELEQRNLVAVEERFRVTRPELAARAMASLFAVRLARGPVAPLDAWLARAESLEDPALAARFLCMRARLARLGGATLERTEADLASACSRARDVDVVAYVDALRLRAVLATELERPEAADLCAEALTLIEGKNPGLEARVRQVLVMGHLRRGDGVRARAEADAALALQRTAGDQAGAGVTLLHLAVGLDETGDLDGGRRACEQALRYFDEGGDVRRGGVARGSLAAFAWEAGDVAAAEALGERALLALRACGDERNEAHQHGFEGLGRAATGDFAGARGSLHRCHGIFTRIGRNFGAQSFSLGLALVLAEAGDLDAAGALLEGARRAREVRPATKLLRALATATVEVLRGERAPQDPGLRELSRTAEKGPVDVRLGRRIAERIVRDLKAHGANESPRREALRPTEPRPLLEIATNADWFSLEGAPRVSLARRDAMRCVLSALVDKHLEDPEAAVSTEELVAAGWPSERFRDDAGQVRLYTAIRTLRRLGLESALLTRGRGYLLAPTLAVSRV